MKIYNLKNRTISDIIKLILMGDKCNLSQFIVSLFFLVCELILVNTMVPDVFSKKPLLSCLRNLFFKKKGLIGRKL